MLVILHCEDVLGFGDEFLQNLGLSDAHIRTRAGYHLLQLLTKHSSSLRMGFLIVYRCLPRHWFTVSLGGASS